MKKSTKHNVAALRVALLITLAALTQIGTSRVVRAQTTTPTPTPAWKQNGANISNTNSGNVGIGTSTPQTPVDIVYSNDNFGFGVNIKNTSTGTMSLTGYGIDSAGGFRVGQFVFVPENYVTQSLRNSVLFSSVGSAKLGFVSSADGTATPDIYFQSGANSPAIYIVGGSGNVGIGIATPTERLHVNGNINVTGNINAKYQDVAEWVPSSQKLSAGTVVILDPDKSNQVIASTVSYDTRVAGVISEQPGLLLGEEGEGKVKVATTGRVKVRVDASRGSIRIGDLLVTSDREGVAMKSVPLVMQGRKIHSPGTIVGKALEPLESGSGEIQVLLSLQ